MVLNAVSNEMNYYQGKKKLVCAMGNDDELA